jgi:hypothetical protein
MKCVNGDAEYRGINIDGIVLDHQDSPEQ